MKLTQHVIYSAFLRVRFHVITIHYYSFNSYKYLIVVVEKCIEDYILGQKRTSWKMK